MNHTPLSQADIEHALTRLNTACLHAQKHGNLETRLECYTQIMHSLEWFKEHGISVHVHGNGYTLSPKSKQPTALVERHRVVVDGIIAYCGDEGHTACIVLLDYLGDDRPRNVLDLALKQEEALRGPWTIDGVSYLHAPIEQEIYQGADPLQMTEQALDQCKSLQEVFLQAMDGSLSA